MILKKDDSLHPVPEEMSQNIIHAIQGALREEKKSFSSRLLKIALSTFAFSLILWIPFLLSFKDQISSIWTVALSIWTLALAVGFSLYYYPQPRLVLPGLWSRMILARLLLVSTVTTIIEILVCPSFVFLESPLSWNPLGPLTDRLMALGGMGLCMAFCGFFFSFLSALFGLGSAWKVVRGSHLKSIPVILGVLLLSQFPILFVQIFSEDLKAFALDWILGFVVGTGFAVWFSFLVMRLFTPVKREDAK